jgi:ubiquinone/menaquinone biosynthesis C-methylase UbiE
MIDRSAQWQLKGNAPKIYDRYIAPAVSAPWYPHFVKAGLPYIKRAIADIGCGTGSFLFHLVEQQEIPDDIELVGVDLNLSMLAVAEEKIISSTKSISWVNADVTQLPFTDNYFHLVYCQQGIQYFEDKLVALKEIHRVVHGKGAFVATVWSEIEACVGYKCLAEAVLKVAGDKAKSSLYAPFSFSEPEVLEGMVKSAGFSLVNVQIIDNFVRFPSIKEFVWHRIYGSPLIDDLPQNDIENVVNEIALELELTLKSYEGKDGLVFPVKANYLIAEK